MRYLPFITLAAIVSAATPERDRQDDSLQRPSTHLFRVAFEGVEDVHALRVHGLVSESPSGSEKGVRPIEIVIQRNVQRPGPLWEWRAAIIAGKQDRRTGRIEFLDRGGKSIVALMVRDAWPHRWSWPTLDAANPSPAIEEIRFFASEVGPGLPADRGLTDKQSALDEMDRQLDKIRKKDGKDQH